MAHDARYDRADEFMDVVLGHWNTWEDDALILDKADNRFADPAKVHRLDHAGRYFQSRGPFSVPRSPQGQPVLIQAGQSGRGQSFAAKWADLVFVIYPRPAGRYPGVRRVQGRGRRRGPRPGERARRAGLLCRASAKPRRRRRKSARSSRRRRATSTRWCCFPKCSTTISPASPWTSRSATRSWPNCRFKVFATG